MIVLDSGSRQGANVISGVYLTDPVRLKTGDKIKADLTLSCTPVCAYCSQQCTILTESCMTGNKWKYYRLSLRIHF